MNQLALLKLGVGSLQQGFPAVTLQMGAERQPQQRQIRASLPPAPHLAELYRNWQLLYLALYSRLAHNTRIIFPQSQGVVTNVSEAGFREICQELQSGFNHWLSSEEFRPLDRELRTHLVPQQEIQVIVETDDLQLRRFPWHLWDFFQDFRRAEVALSTPRFQWIQPAAPNPTRQVRVLAVLGNSAGLDLQQEQSLLTKLPQTRLEFLAEPTKLELSNQLWRQNWDIFFFAGHSTSSDEGEVGVLQINPTDNLTISDLENALRRAIENGLQLAIFNSCDGLGIVRELEKLNLQIPQVIVMREPVPDRVAQAFLTYFLQAYSQGQSLYLAVREARERLQSLENLSGHTIAIPEITHHQTARQSQKLQDDNKNVAMDSSNSILKNSDLEINTEPSPRQLLWDQPPDENNSLRERNTNSYPDFIDEDAFPCASWLPVICQNPAVEPPSWDTLRQVNRPGSGIGLASHLAKWKVLLLTSLLATGFVTGLRALGGVQPFELMAYDHLMRLRPAEPPDDRILVVEATEADVKRYGFPLPDQTISQVIDTLEIYEPRVVGLDIFRDSPAPPGTEKLTQLLQENPRVIGICSVADITNIDNKPGIAPHSGLPETRLGYSDVVFDPDRIIRRHLLFMQPDYNDPCTTDHSLSMRVALNYLASEGIVPQNLPGARIQLGDLILNRLNSNSGPYQNIDHRGIQILLNYRFSSARRVSMTDLLQGNVDPRWIEDQIILIGVSAPISSDYFLTPYSASQWPYRQVPGVLVQAHMVSQIISAVLNDRPLIKVGTIWTELLLIWVWSGVGGLIGLLMRRSRNRAIGVVVACGVLWLSCWGGFILGFWMPLVPSAIVLVIMGGLAPVRLSPLSQTEWSMLKSQST
ncbi:MAG: CHASE2 domain-containing protein [Microcoleaceae cyanobacterium]